MIPKCAVMVHYWAHYRGGESLIQDIWANQLLPRVYSDVRINPGEEIDEEFDLWSMLPDQIPHPIVDWSMRWYYRSQRRMAIAITSDPLAAFDVCFAGHWQIPPCFDGQRVYLTPIIVPELARDIVLNQKRNYVVFNCKGLDSHHRSSLEDVVMFMVRTYHLDIVYLWGAWGAVPILERLDGVKIIPIPRTGLSDPEFKRFLMGARAFITTSPWDRPHSMEMAHGFGVPSIIEDNGREKLPGAIYICDLPNIDLNDMGAYWDRYLAAKQVLGIEPATSWLRGVLEGQELPCLQI